MHENFSLKKLAVEDVVAYIQSKPKGVYQRRIGYLFELLTLTKLPIADTGKTNYADLIDPDKYVTGKVERNIRWWIDDKLLGTWKFCPIIRKTPALLKALEPDFRKMIADLTSQRDHNLRSTHF